MTTTRIYLSVWLVMLTGLSCAAQAPAPLADVRTWGDLREQPPVASPSAANEAPLPPCRLGVNFAAAKLYGGVVVYCLAQEKPTGAAFATNLGPFQVEVARPKSAQAIFQEWSMAGPAGQQASGEALFMQSIPLNEPGDYTITVKRPRGDPKRPSFEAVASTTVTVANEPGPIWSPWPLNAADGAVGILAGDDKNQREAGASGVANPSTGVAIPQLAGCFVSGAPDSPGPNQPLPELLPSEPDPGLKLQATGSLLIVTLDHGILPYFCDEKFLTCWWVNGRPFTPKLAPMAFSDIYFMRHNGAWGGNLAGQMTFQVEFHPEILGAKKGDEIGVQLLLCPRGWEYSGPVQNSPMFNDDWEPIDADMRSVEPRLTNRITFAYTGDPIRMAPLAR